ncbi:MAG: HesA/MoeB/ThiF family protein [Methanotrichaceae archaeon]|nr:HesA/MoeB/ThiF family protein [Methanotrichaceae archaeon]
MLGDSEKIRYSRQIRLFDEGGQEKLKRTTVFIAGAGGLGSVVSIYMAAAGFGKIRIVDCDTVEPSNLNRQILHWSCDVGRMKAESAEETLLGINPDIKVEALRDTIAKESIERLLEGCDLIMDALDNFKTRYLLNKAALKKGIPLIHGAICGFQGQVATIVPGRSACLRCIFPQAAPPRIFPALGSTCGIIGSVQVTEAIKYVIAAGQLLENRLLIWDGLSACMEQLEVKRNPRCQDCSSDPNSKPSGIPENANE